jgi:YidC/Oxa1 family membrane protein insertase
MDYKKIVLYFAAGIVLLLLWNAWQRDYGTLSVKPASTLQQTQNQTPNDTTNTANNSAQTPTTTQSGTQNKDNFQPSTTPSVVATNINTKNLIHIKTDVLNVEVNPDGGSLVGATLPKYPVSLKQPNVPFPLLNYDNATYYVAQAGFTNLPGVKHSLIPFKSAEKSYQMQNGSKQLNVVLQWQSPNGIKVVRTLSFTRGKYVVKIHEQITNGSKKVWEGRYYMQTKRRNAPQASAHVLGFHTFFGIAISSPSKPYNKISFKDLDESPVNQTIKGGWLAFIQHYFLTAWVPKPTVPYYYFSQTGQNQIYTVGLMSPDLKIQPSQTVKLTNQFYVGPEIATNLNAIAPHLALTIDYGWLWIISVAIFWLMKHIFDVIGNWGWSIVLVTLIIKALFFKLSEKSYVSMAKMRMLAPKIAALKDRITDRQELSRETMALYKKEKVNPLGGCLPMLIQIPVFIALYWVLIESVELRQAPFIFWIHNLAAKDPYYILPVIMGLSMFVQQKLSPSTGDPTQQKVMMFLPVVFTVLFFNFPSGLVLYWTVNNIISITQQWWIFKRFEQGKYTSKPHKKKKNKKRKK